VGDAGGEAAGDGKLFGTAQRFLGASVLQHLIANLILALASAESDFEGGEQRLGANGALE
jgi:hypothetical protein